MQITASAVSLNVAVVPASLTREDAGMNVVFLLLDWNAPASR